MSKRVLPFESVNGHSNIVRKRRKVKKNNKNLSTVIRAFVAIKEILDATNERITKQKNPILHYRKLGNNWLTCYFTYFE